MKICSKCGVEKPETSEHFPKHIGGKNGLRPYCKTCAAEYCRQWRENNAMYSRQYCESNKEVIAQQRRGYREKNKEALSEYCIRWHKDNKENEKLYYEKNKEAIVAYHKQWYEKTKDIRLEYCRIYRQDNPEKRLLSCKNWEQNNPDRIIIISQRYRARKRALPCSLTVEQWLLARQCFGNLCAYCGKEKPLAQEHFIAVACGGEYTHNNIIPACKSCNSSKADKNFFEWYEKQEFYSKVRERKILKFLNYRNGIQQLALL